MSKPDNNRAVVAILEDVGDGKSSLIFDDVRLDRETGSSRWLFENTYTQKQYPNKTLDNLELTPEDYRIIGENLVLRLLALNGRSK